MKNAVKARLEGPPKGRALPQVGGARNGNPVPESAGSGGPLMLSLDLIDEDPAQPRAHDNPGFSPPSIAELASTIALRGVKSPVSVRKNPTVPGRYIINHGARRYRASKVAGKAEIPSFIDDDYSQVDQVIENLQRNELTAREIANWIGREMAAGKKKGEIAKSLGKSAAFVSQHVTLLDLPDPIACAFNSARVNDVTVVNELVTAFKKSPSEVTNWLEDDNQELTRGAVKLFRQFLEQRLPGAESDEADVDEETAEPSVDEAPVGGERRPTGNSTKSGGGAEQLRKTIVQVRHADRAGRLILTRRPHAEGYAWLKYDDNDEKVETSLKEVRLVALLGS